MHPDMASALASQHRHEMTAKAGHHARTTPLPRYRVTWSRTALSTAAADGARRGHSWVIVISATRGL